MHDVKNKYVTDTDFYSASKMTYIVLDGALNSTHSLTRPPTVKAATGNRLPGWGNHSNITEPYDITFILTWKTSKTMS